MLPAACTWTYETRLSSYHRRFQSGHTLSDRGTNSFTATAGSDTVDIDAWDLPNLAYKYTTPGVYTVTVRAESTDSDNFTDDVGASSLGKTRQAIWPRLSERKNRNLPYP
ncbi:hypothetical protein OAM69_07245 [bacterium]|nr:hypothetical protein [bacterium]